jgi:hypothetical protein
LELFAGSIRRPLSGSDSNKHGRNRSFHISTSPSNTPTTAAEQEEASQLGVGEDASSVDQRVSEQPRTGHLCAWSAPCLKGGSPELLRRFIHRRAP